MNSSPQPPSATLMQMISGGWISQAIAVAARLGIADLIADESKTANELAEATRTHAPSIARLLRALSSIGIFTRVENNRYSNSPISEYLRDDVSGSLRAAAAMNGEEHHVAWGNLAHSVQTGEPAFDHVYGENFFQYVSKNAAASETFNRAMTSYASTNQSAIVAAYDFSGLQTLCDVGGGHGTLLSLICKANPGLRGVLFDLPHVVAGAPEVLARHGVEDRIEIQSGDFFESVPQADAHIMSHIVHDWDDERALKILQSCRKAVKDGGKVLVVEMVIPEDDAPFVGKWMDLNMLVMTPGGRERTQAEYSALLEKAGYKLNRIVPSESPVSVIEGLAV